MNDSIFKESGSEVKQLRAEKEEATRKLKQLQEFKEKYDETQKLIMEKEDQIRELEEKLAISEQ